MLPTGPPLPTVEALASHVAGIGHADGQSSADRCGHRLPATRTPSPDALLEAASGSARPAEDVPRRRAGRRQDLRDAARRRSARRREGVDVVIGVVETHGRKETEALLDGLEIIPRRQVDYKGRMLEEMDLDAILARRPQLVLVDELAHTNAPGSRHPKRYLDVEELLAAGIDVYTTLNIQHVESLNDVVAQITRIRVRETVPDCDHRPGRRIELIDLTPGRSDPAAEAKARSTSRIRPSARSSIISRPAI